MHPATYGGYTHRSADMFFNSLGHRRVMANVIERVFTFVDSPRERPWVSMGALAIFILLGAAWVNQAQVLPGVSVSETGLSDPILDIIWYADGDQALALVQDGSGAELMVRSSEGTWSAVECACNVTAIGGLQPKGFLLAWMVGLACLPPGQAILPPAHSVCPVVHTASYHMTAVTKMEWLTLETGTTRTITTWYGLH